MTSYDAVIVGGGHNALVAAAYLARAGKRVVVLEARSAFGGAAVSETPWEGIAARLSRYSYLVSLLPRGIIDDLGIRIDLRRRRYSSYTPVPSDPTRGILVDTEDPDATAQSFLAATGDRLESARFSSFSERLAPLARTVFPTVTAPLPSAQQLRDAVGDADLWDALTQRPLGDLVNASLATDLARGISLTDGLIGTFARSDEASLEQNRCFLYHVIGGGTGDWDVPVGGMGRLSAELERVAREAGAELRPDAAVTSVTPDGEVRFDGAAPGAVTGRLVLSAVGPAVLDGLLSAGGANVADSARPEGAQVKVNMLLRRLPKLHDAAVSPRAAFSGTFHVNEAMSQLDAAYDRAAGGSIPEPLPAEIYCHSLTDPSILGPELQAAGAQTLTLFGLHVPHRLISDQSRPNAREQVLQAAKRSLDSVLAEPIDDCIAIAADGAPCIEARTTADLEYDLGMTGGNIFHGPLSWPWLTDGVDARDLDVAARWGVDTQHPRVLRCGSSAQRGGAVSGIGGHNAAHAALALLG